MRQMPCSGRWLCSGGAKVWCQRTGWQAVSRVDVRFPEGTMPLVTSPGFVIGGRVVDSHGYSMPSIRRGAMPMIIDTHTHVVSSNKVKHPLDPGARGWSTEVSNNVEDLIVEMDRAGAWIARHWCNPTAPTASITPTSATAPHSTPRARSL